MNCIISFSVVFVVGGGFTFVGGLVEDVVVVFVLEMGGRFSRSDCYCGSTVESYPKHEHVHLLHLAVICQLLLLVVAVLMVVMVLAVQAVILVVVVIIQIL